MSDVSVKYRYTLPILKENKSRKRTREALDVFFENMKLRDQFAMHAPDANTAMPFNEHCLWRYRYADAMIKAREE